MTGYVEELARQAPVYVEELRWVAEVNCQHAAMPPHNYPTGNKLPFFEDHMFRGQHSFVVKANFHRRMPWVARFAYLRRDASQQTYLQRFLIYIHVSCSTPPAKLTTSPGNNCMP